MNDEQRSSGPHQPRAETELSDYQHQAEKLAFENKMLRAVLDSMPDNISIKDLEGRLYFRQHLALPVPRRNEYCGCSR
jgi:hypothetical protein